MHRKNRQQHYHNDEDYANNNILVYKSLHQMTTNYTTQKNKVLKHYTILIH